MLSNDKRTLDELYKILHQDKTPSTEKLGTLILKLKSREALEQVAPLIPENEWPSLFEKLFVKKSHSLEHLPPLLVSMPHAIFSSIVNKLSEKELKSLSPTCLSEPMQHHISLLIHEEEKAIKELETECLEVQVEITLLRTETLKRSEALAFLERINSLSLKASEEAKRVDKALILAWSSERADLVDNLTRERGAFLRIQNHFIGEKKPPYSGLYILFFEKLFSLYGDRDSLDSARDEEPAIEGLSRFAFWYVQDFVKAGLLKPLRDGSLSVELKEHLLEKVQKELEKKGLTTVKDLKEAFIFSELSLSEFLYLSSL